MTARVEYALIDTQHWFRFIGEVRYSDVTALPEFIENLDHSIPFEIDLSQASMIDSTALGVMAMMARKARENGLEQPEVFVSHPMIVEVLKGVCFDRIFRIKEIQQASPTPASGVTELPGVQLEMDALTETVKQAHQTLAEISQENAQRFRDVNSIINELQTAS